MTFSASPKFIGLFSCFGPPLGLLDYLGIFLRKRIGTHEQYLRTGAGTAEQSKLSLACYFSLGEEVKHDVSVITV
jgi:hypothetical protein